MVTIPPHTSHRLQPLDLACFGPLKKLQLWSRTANTYRLIWTHNVCYRVLWWHVWNRFHTVKMATWWGWYKGSSHTDCKWKTCQCLLASMAKHVGCLECQLCTINKSAAAYTRCLKNFFGFNKYSSVTDMLLQPGLPTFNTILHNNRLFSFMARVTLLTNVLVQSTLMCCWTVIFVWCVCLTVCLCMCLSAVSYTHLTLPTIYSV